MRRERAAGEFDIATRDAGLLCRELPSIDGTHNILNDLPSAFFIQPIEQRGG
jgi:hypothetical protein